MTEIFGLDKENPNFTLANYSLEEVARLSMALGGLSPEEASIRVKELAEERSVEFGEAGYEAALLQLTPGSNTEAAEQRLAAAVESLGIQHMLIKVLLTIPDRESIKLLIENSTLTQKTLAQRVGASEPEVSKVLNDKRNNPQLLRKLFEAAKTEYLTLHQLAAPSDGSDQS